LGRYALTIAGKLTQATQKEPDIEEAGLKPIASAADARAKTLAIGPKILKSLT